jgi:hypothetical protein
MSLYQAAHNGQSTRCIPVQSQPGPAVKPSKIGAAGVRMRTPVNDLQLAHFSHAYPDEHPSRRANGGRHCPASCPAPGRSGLRSQQRMLAVSSPRTEKHPAAPWRRLAPPHVAPARQLGQVQWGERVQYTHRQVGTSKSFTSRIRLRFRFVNSRNGWGGVSRAPSCEVSMVPC